MLEIGNRAFSVWLYLVGNRVVGSVRRSLAATHFGAVSVIRAVRTWMALRLSCHDGRTWQLGRLTQMNNWQPAPEARNKSVMKSLSDIIEPLQSRNPKLFPNLRNSKAIVLASDYSGEEKYHPFQILSFLLVDIESANGEWNNARHAIREQHLPDWRELAFKSLGDQRQQKALIPFLKAVDTLNGVLFTVAIEKSIKPFSDCIPIPNPPAKERQAHDKHTWEKLLRISNFAGAIVGGLCNAEQEIHWVMDYDNIIANDELKKTTAHVCNGFFNYYCPSRNGKVFYTAAHDYQNDNGLAVDLVSITDIAAGATAETLAALGSEKMPRSTQLFVPILKPRSTKTDFITMWLADKSSTLMKVNVFVRREGENYLISMNQTESAVGDPIICAPIWTPLAKGWANSARYWNC